jgi:hypothetical protein
MFIQCVINYSHTKPICLFYKIRDSRLKNCQHKNFEDVRVNDSSMLFLHYYKFTWLSC